MTSQPWASMSRLRDTALCRGRQTSQVWRACLAHPSLRLLVSCLMPTKAPLRKLLPAIVLPSALWSGLWRTDPMWFSVFCQCTRHWNLHPYSFRCRASHGPCRPTATPSWWPWARPKQMVRSPSQLLRRMWAPYSPIGLSQIRIGNWQKRLLPMPWRCGTSQLWEEPSSTMALAAAMRSLPFMTVVAPAAWGATRTTLVVDLQSPYTRRSGSSHCGWLCDPPTFALLCTAGGPRAGRARSWPYPQDRAAWGGESESRGWEGSEEAGFGDNLHWTAQAGMWQVSISLWNAGLAWGPLFNNKIRKIVHVGEQRAAHSSPLYRHIFCSALSAHVLRQLSSGSVAGCQKKTCGFIRHALFTSQPSSTGALVEF